MWQLSGVSDAESNCLESSVPLSFTSLQPIRSVNQRALASQWDRLAAGRRFPAFTEFKPEPDKYDPKQLVVWGIDDVGAADDFTFSRRILVDARRSIGT